MKRLTLAAAVIASAALIYYLAARPAPPGPEAAQKAASLSGPTLEGKTVSLSDFAGKVVLVDFWATWCDPCQREIPGLVELHKRLAPKGFAVLGVSMDEEGAKVVGAFAKAKSISYPLVLNGGERPPAGWVVPGLPTSYLVGRDGTMLKRWFGEKDLTELGRDVEAALGK